MLIDRKKLQTPILLCATVILLFGGLAIVSRTRASPSINAIFSDGDYQSVTEHFFSGMASPSLFFIFGVGFSWSLWWAGGCDTSPNKQNRLANWLIARSERFSFNVSVFLISVAYVLTSYSWELDQAAGRGYFQYNQFVADCFGALIWLLMMRHFSSRMTSAD